MFHPALKFTAEYCKEEVNFLDLNIKLIDGKFKTDLFVKHSDTHQFLDPTSSHPYHFKKGRPCNQSLRLNTICSDNENFDKHCNNFKKRIMERGYNEKMIRNQILRVRKHSRKDLVEREKPQMSEQKLTFNITYHPAFQNFRTIMEELHILLTPNKEHKKLFCNVSFIEFRNGKSLKDFLVRAILPKLNGGGRSEPCWKKTYLVCDSISTATTFTTEACQETFKIQSGPLTCVSEKAPYLLKCKVCGEVPYVGKAKTKF